MTTDSFSALRAIHQYPRAIYRKDGRVIIINIPKLFTQVVLRYKFVPETINVNSVNNF